MLTSTVLRVALEDARREGVSFEVAWPEAVRATGATADWLAALDASRSAFERAFNREPPTVADRVLALIAEDITVGDVDDDEWRICERSGCERRMEGRPAKARYCSEECCKLACRERERLSC
jgi:hypothetical protein